MKTLTEFLIMPQNCKWSKEKAYSFETAYGLVSSWYSPKTPIAIMNTETGETKIFTR